MIVWKSTGQAFQEACIDQLWNDIFDWPEEWFNIWAKIYNLEELIYHIEESMRGGAGW